MVGASFVHNVSITIDDSKKENSTFRLWIKSGRRGAIPSTASSSDFSLVAGHNSAAGVESLQDKRA